MKHQKGKLGTEKTDGAGERHQNNFLQITAAKFNLGTPENQLSPSKDV